MAQDLSKTAELLKQRIDKYLQTQQSVKEAAQQLKKEEETKSTQSQK